MGDGDAMRRGALAFVKDLRSGFEAEGSPAVAFLESYAAALAALPDGLPSYAMLLWNKMLCDAKRKRLFFLRPATTRLLDAPWFFPALCERMLPAEYASDVARAYRDLTASRRRKPRA